MKRALAVLFSLSAALSACDKDPVVPDITTQTVNLRPGEVFTTTAAEANVLLLDGGDNGAEYTYIPFFASEAGSARLALEVAGTGIQNMTGPPVPAVASQSLDALVIQDDDRARFHGRLREIERRDLQDRIPAAREWYSSQRSQRSSVPQISAAVIPAPSLGSLLRLNVRSDSACVNPTFRTGRVAAITDRAIVVTDTLNPAGGFTDAELRAIGATFDTLVYPVTTRAFGEPTDIDSNGKVVLFFTSAVNDLTKVGSGSVTSGFFFGRDLFPQARSERFGNGCAGSNEGEIFYLLTPDPARGGSFSKDNVRRSTVAVVAHEFQHLINSGRRLYINSVAANRVNEELWLNEGLSHIAEELLFYAVTRTSPRENLTLQRIRTPGIYDPFLNYVLGNMGRYRTYLQNPDTASLMGIDVLPTRGASWAFLRYAADREPGSDEAFWFKLVNSPEIGLRNLSAAINGTAINWMQDWTVSVYTDDIPVPVDPRFQQPSWNFRSILPELFAGSGSRFPLQSRSLATGTPTVVTLRGGGAAFLRFGVAPSGRAEIRTTSGGATPTATGAVANLRISIVRTR